MLVVQPQFAAHVHREPQVAEFESDRVAERVRDVKADQRARGRYV